MSNVLVCPVVFNEKGKIERVIQRFLESKVCGQVDYLVLDDASTDGTTEIIAQFSAQGVMTIRHQQRQGVGAAIRSAIKYAQAHDYEILVIMAGNDKDDPEQIPCILGALLAQGMDFVQGSRYLEGARIGGDMPLYRRWATKWHPWLMSVMTGKKVTDTTNGFRGIRLSFLDNSQIDIDQAWLNQYELEPYILYKALVLGVHFAEVPVTKIYPAKKLGYTKMKPLVGWWSILKPLFYLRLGIRR